MESIILKVWLITIFILISSSVFSNEDMTTNTFLNEMFNSTFCHEDTDKDKKYGAYQINEDKTGIYYHIENGNVVHSQFFEWEDVRPLVIEIKISRDTKPWSTLRFHKLSEDSNKIKLVGNSSLYRCEMEF